MHLRSRQDTTFPVKDGIYHPLRILQAPFIAQDKRPRRIREQGHRHPGLVRILHQHRQIAPHIRARQVTRESQHPRRATPQRRVIRDRRRRPDGRQAARAADSGQEQAWRLGADPELLVDEEVIPRAAGAGAARRDGVGDVGRGTAPVRDGLAAGFGDEVDGSGAEDVIEVRDGGGCGPVEEGVVAGDDVGALLDAGVPVHLEKFLHTDVLRTYL